MQLLHVAVASPVKRFVLMLKSRIDALLVRATTCGGSSASSATACRRCGPSGGSRQQLELVHRRRALAVRRAEAVGAGVAAAEDDDALARRRGSGPATRVARDDLVLLRQEVHREVDALELAAGHRQVARLASRRRRARSRRTRGAARRPVTSTPTLHARRERHALGRHLLHAAVDEVLLHLEVGDAVAQQPADAVGALEDA